MAASVVLLTMNADLYDFKYFKSNYFSATYVKYEAMGALLSAAFCILVTAFLLLCWWSFLPARELMRVDKFLTAGTVIGGFIGGKALS